MRKEAVIKGHELTAQQEQVLRHEQIGKQWLWGAMPVSGELEPLRLQHAVQELAAAEDVLRSGFERLPNGERLLQVVRVESAVKVETTECEPAAAAAVTRRSTAAARPAREAAAEPQAALPSPPWVSRASPPRRRRAPC